MANLGRTLAAGSVLPGAPLAVSLLLLGCTGDILGGPSMSTGPAGPGPGSPSAPGGGNLPPAPVNSEPGASQLRRLTLLEYRNTLRDLLGVDNAPTLESRRRSAGPGVRLHDRCGDHDRHRRAQAPGWRRPAGPGRDAEPGRPGPLYQGRRRGRALCARVHRPVRPPRLPPAAGRRRDHALARSVSGATRPGRGGHLLRGHRRRDHGAVAVAELPLSKRAGAGGGHQGRKLRPLQLVRDGLAAVLFLLGIHAG